MLIYTLLKEAVRRVNRLYGIKAAYIEYTKISLYADKLSIHVNTHALVMYNERNKIEKIK